jgi:hypothetical protein
MVTGGFIHPQGPNGFAITKTLFDAGRHFIYGLLCAALLEGRHFKPLPESPDESFTYTHGGSSLGVSMGQEKLFEFFAVHNVSSSKSASFRISTAFEVLV